MSERSLQGNMKRLAGGIGFVFTRRATCFRALPVLLALLLAAPVARADANDAAAAQALFDEGKRLMAGGRYAAACPKFAESQRLDPGIGTMLWLADCHAKNGRNASAWALFAEAEALAAKHGDKRAALAREEAKKLEPKLSKLVIEVSSDADVPDLDIKRDGVTLGRPVWGAPIPTDPGTHTITASAPGKTTWQSEVTVPRDSGTATIAIPPLADAPPAPNETIEVEPHAPAADANGNGNATRGRTQRVVGVALVGVGIAGAAVGSYFGLQVSSKRDESAPHCNGNDCNATGFDLRKDALTAATISDVAFIAGAAALVGGVVLYLTAPSSRSTKTTAFGAPLPSGGAAAFVHASF